MTRQFTSSNPRQICVKRSTRGLVRRWEKPSQLHWVATACFKLGSFQPLRCLPVIAYSLGDLSDKRASTCTKQSKAKNYGDSSSSNCKLEHSHHVPWSLRLNIDVVCLQETWLAYSGSLMEGDYTFFWQNLSQNEPRQFSIDFAVRDSQKPPPEFLRILALRMKTSAGFVNIISA